MRTRLRFIGIILLMVALVALTAACDLTIPTQATPVQPLNTSVPPPTGAAPTPSAGPQPEAKRVQFPASSTMASMQGNVAAGGFDSYVVGVMAGQTLAVNVSSPQNDVILAVFGADGTVLISDHPGATTWSGAVPSTQDYFIDLKATGAATAYTLQVTLSAQGTAGPEPSPIPGTQPQARRITFAPGSTSAAVNGIVKVGQSERWVLKALAGQTMTVNVTSYQQRVILSIWGADGTVLISDHAGATNWSGPLPSTQDYFIALQTSSTVRVAYTLRVTIPAGPGPTPAVKRITFPAGGTSASVQGVAPVGGADHWVLKALRGQTMTASVSSYQGGVILVIWGADGTVLISDHAGATHWSGPLPSTQDYFIDVITSESVDIHYTLQVTIPSLPGPTPAAKRISFPAGGTSATVYGSIAVGGMDRWVIKAMAGQTMTVDVTSTAANVILVIFGADGTVLISDHAEATHWSGPLPKTQDYYIDLKPMAGTAADYTLTVTIPSLPGPTPAAKRISFPAGGTSATVYGSIAVGGMDRWVIKAMAGQTMTVDVTSTAANVILVIFGADGTVLISDHAEATHWSGPLPRTQDYYIDLKPMAGTAADYTLTVTIPPAGG